MAMETQTGRNARKPAATEKTAKAGKAGKARRLLSRAGMAAMALCLLMLAACGGSTAATTTAAPTTAATTTAAPATEAATEASTAEATTTAATTTAAPATEATTAAPAGRTDGLPEYTGGPAELRLTWWGGDARAERTNKVIELFQAAYPEITIKGEPRPSDSYWDNLNTQIAGGSAPDIMQFGGNYPDFVSRDVLLPLEGYKGSLLQIGSADLFDQSVLETGSMNGHLYGICLGTNSLVIIYNKTMLEAAGAPLPGDSMSWADLIAYGEQIKPLLPAGVFPFVDNSVNQANYISYYFRQIDEPLWTAELESHATEAGARSWLQMWEDMRASGLIPDIETTAGYEETSVDNSILVAGKAAIGMIWSNQVGTYQEAMTDTLALTQLPTGDHNGLAIQVSQYLAVNSKCPNPEAAALFVNYFVTTPDAGRELATDRGIPSSPVVRSATVSEADEASKLVYAYYDVAASRSIPQDPNLPNDQEFIDSLKIIGQRVAFKEISVDQGGKDIYDLIQRLMAK
ncbi:MAG: sugar ABC transporter substrate-binding protein [Clostridiales bacterium]|nr:sugar ABC transporter substrate-binding protein [Clostridiales bacterium]